MNEVRALELIAKELTGEMNHAEQEELMAWVKASQANQTFYRETKELWEAAEIEPETMSVDTARAWQQLEPRLEESPSARIVAMRPRFPWWRLAAAAVLLVGGVLLWQWMTGSSSPAMVEVATGSQERKELTLPDESTVVLNEASVLRYPEQFSARRVELTGEAFFSVQPDAERPFSVASGELVTRVVGTRFVIRAYDTESEVEVQVQEGLVLVAPRSARGEEIQLSAGKRVSYQKDVKKLTPITDVDPNADAFVDQTLEFTDTPLREVVADMSAYYGTPLRLGNRGVGNCRVNIAFTNVELDEALEKLSFIANLTIRRENGALVLDGEPCDGG